jgi:hypothetical protein
LPGHQRGGAFDHLDAAAIGKPAQAELDRIEPRRRRELVREAFHRETIGRLAGRADRCRTQRGILQPVDEHLEAVRRIRRVGIL